jgi:hypothetical protein
MEILQNQSLVLNNIKASIAQVIIWQEVLYNVKYSIRRSRECRDDVDRLELSSI